MTQSPFYTKTVAMKLSQLPKDQQATITSIAIPQVEVKKRLEAFGLQVGLPITCVRKTPFGGPRAFLLSHGVFAIDIEVTNHIEVSFESKQ